MQYSVSTPLQLALLHGNADFIWYLARIHVDFSPQLAPHLLYRSCHFTIAEADDGRGSAEGLEEGGEASQEDREVEYQVLRENPDLLDLLVSRMGQPRPLLQITLDAVRSHFRQSGLPFDNIRALPLPASLLSELLYDV